MLDTMFRSGVPPHIGQSPELGSENVEAKDPARRIPHITNGYFFIILSAFITCRRFSQQPEANS
jgi:hypothetical protein